MKRFRFFMSLLVASSFFLAGCGSSSSTVVNTDTPQTIAIDKITAYAEDQTQPVPTVEDYADSGVTGVTEENLSEMNALIASLTAEDVDTTEEIQAIFDDNGLGYTDPTDPTVPTVPTDPTDPTVPTDTEAPVITLLGTTPVIVTQGDTSYTDAGATATDDVDGDITANIVTVNPVDTNTVGTYTVTYNVSDAATNAATEVTRTVTVVAADVRVADATNTNTTVTASPTELPVDTNTTITVTLADNNGVLLTTGGDTVTLVGKGSTSTSVISLVTDNGNGTYTFTATQSVDTKVTYTATVNDITITDTEVVIYTAGVITDTTIPVITLVGVNPQEVVIATAYTELGATASDNVDGDITANIVIDASDVNTSTLGTYTVTYNVTDAAGNSADQVSRTVNVVATDTTLPVITLVGVNPQEIALGTAYAELGATASDNVDGDITANIVIDDSAVNTGAEGTYTVTYDVTDAAGNAALTVSREVIVLADTILPVITLVGVNPQEIVLGDAYTELGATASDNVDGDITANIVIDASAVNTSAAGTYTVSYDVNDSTGNDALTVSREVIVSADTTLPVITLVGANPQQVVIDTTYTELGATASDNVDGDITASIVIDISNVDTSTLGTYTVTYDVNDSVGNDALTVSRTVTVVAEVVVVDVVGQTIIFTDVVGEFSFYQNNKFVKVNAGVFEFIGTWSGSLATELVLLDDTDAPIVITTVDNSDLIYHYPVVADKENTDPTVTNVQGDAIREKNDKGISHVYFRDPDPAGLAFSSFGFDIPSWSPTGGGGHWEVRDGKVYAFWGTDINSEIATYAFDREPGIGITGNILTVTKAGDLMNVIVVDEYWQLKPPATDLDKTAEVAVPAIMVETTFYDKLMLITDKTDGPSACYYDIPLSAEVNGFVICAGISVDGTTVWGSKGDNWYINAEDDLEIKLHYDGPENTSTTEIYRFSDALPSQGTLISEYNKEGVFDTTSSISRFSDYK